MSVEKNSQSLENLGNAIARLADALAEQPDNSLIVDGTIQRFEFVIELFWKTLKRLLNDEGIEATTPKDALKHAYRVGWLNNETAWLQMLKDRNETSHIYDEHKALEIYRNIRHNFSELQRTYIFLKQRFNNTSKK